MASNPPAASAATSAPRARTAIRQRQHAVLAGARLLLEDRRDRPDRRDREVRRGKRRPHRPHRRQRHDRVPEPVRRADDEAIHGVAFLARRRREHPANRVVLRLQVAPAAVHPQPQLGVAPDVHLEHVGAALRELANRVRGRRPTADRRRARRPCGTGRRGAAARRPGRPACRCGARARPAPTSSPPAG